MDVFMQRVSAVISLARLPNAAHPALALLLGTLVSGAAYTTFNFYASLAVLLLVHSAVTIWNDLEDVEIDRRNRIHTALTDSTVNAKSMTIIVCCVLAVAIGLSGLLSPMAWAITMVFIALGWLYNSRPFQLSRRPIASMVVLAVSYGVLPVLLGAILGTIHYEIIVLAIFCGIGRVSLSLLKDYKDGVGDAQSNKRTFLLVYGHRAVRRLSVALAIISLPVIAYVIFNHVPYAWQLLYVASMAVLYVATVAYRLQLFVRESYSDLNAVFHRCLYVQLIVDSVVVLWLMLS
jgi:4-hydroxybenzoate polyprenyltransferase